MLIEIIYWISMICMWVALGYNVYAGIMNYRIRKNMEQALKNTENMRVEYERARDAHLDRLNKLTEYRKD
jgi:hypothetical protein